MGEEKPNSPNSRKKEYNVGCQELRDKGNRKMLVKVCRLLDIKMNLFWGSDVQCSEYN